MIRRLAAAIPLALAFAFAQAAPFAYFGSTSASGPVVNVVDVETLSQVATIPTTARVTSVAALPGERYVYAAMAFADRVAIIDSLRQAVVAEVAVRGPGQIAILPGKEMAYVLPTRATADFGVGPVAVIDALARTQAPTLTSVVDARAVAISRDASRAYFVKSFTPSVGATPQGILIIVDTASQQVVDTLFLPGSVPDDVALHPRLPVLYVGRANDFALVDLATRGITAIATAPGPLGAAFDAPGDHLYVSVGSAVSVYETARNSLQATIPFTGPPPATLDVGAGRLFATLDDHSPGAGSASQLRAVDPTTGNGLAGFAAPGISAGSRFVGGLPPPLFTAAGVLTGLWWNAAQPGWGVHLSHRGQNVFATWFTYDAQGTSKWYFASSCGMTTTLACASCVAKTACEGTLYQAAGPKFFGVPFNARAVVPSPAGSVRIDFNDVSSATLSYTLGSRQDRIALTKVPFATPSLPPAVDYTDLWASPDEPGWGMAITQTAGGTLFLGWFVYDDAGKPVWQVSSDCLLNGGRSGCSGTLYRASGPPGPSVTSAFDSSRVALTPVGTVNIAFQTKDTAFLTYTVNGVPGFKGLWRFLF